MIDRLRTDEAGLSRLEWLGIVGTIVVMSMFVPPIRGAIADVYIPNIWDDTFASGILIGIGSFVIFGGAVYLVLYTNLGAKLGFLVAGAACWISAVLLAHILGRPRSTGPAFAMGAAYGNTVMLGIPLCLNMFGDGLQELLNPRRKAVK